MTIEPIQLQNGGWGSPSSSYKEIPMGRSKPLIVHEDFAPLLRRLTSVSPIMDWAPTRSAVSLGAKLKHTLLVGDFFHLGRMVYYAAAIQKRLQPNFRSGWSVLEFNEKDVPEALRRGVISPKDAAWANEPVPFGRTTVTRRQLSRLFEQQAGLNIGKIQDALYHDMATKLGSWAGPLAQVYHKVTDPTVGSYNRFLFDKLSRGLMIESAVSEYEKAAKQFPNTSPRKLMRDIAKDTNEFFGNLGKQGVLKAQWEQDLARVFLLAPQWVEGLVRKEVTGPARIVRGGLEMATGGRTGYREGLPKLGTTGKGMGTGLAFMFALTQAINLFTRRKFTWQNEEKEHRMDAYIPGFGADKEGFWISPLALFNEITHDVYRLAHERDSFVRALAQIAGNKESPLVRAALVLKEGRSPTGTYYTSDPAIVAGAAEQLAPAPISFSRYFRAAGHALAPGMIEPNLPGQMGRQIAGTIGLKVEPGKSPLQNIQRLARDYAVENKRPETIHFEETDQPSYSRLRQAVRNEDPHGAWKMLDKLREQGRSDGQIVEAMRRWKDRDFTWSKDAENEFFFKLTPEEQKTYSKAIFQKMDEYERFVEYLMKEPAKK